MCLMLRSLAGYFLNGMDLGLNLVDKFKKWILNLIFDSYSPLGFWSELGRDGSHKESLKLGNV